MSKSLKALLMQNRMDPSFEMQILAEEEILKQFDELTAEKNRWHRLSNSGDDGIRCLQNNYKILEAKLAKCKEQRNEYIKGIGGFEDGITSTEATEIEKEDDDKLEEVR